MATKTGIVFKADGTTSEVEYTDKTSYQTMRDAVEGDITSVGLGMPGNMDAYANDNGYAEALLLNRKISRYLNRPIVGNVFIPNVTTTKRAKLQKAGLLPTP
jgi:hypothetical protein